MTNQVNQSGIISQTVNKQMQEVKSPSINKLMNTFLDGEGMRKRFDDLLGKRAPQFISSLVSIVNADTKLQQAFYEAPMTVIQAALKAATYDLPIDQNLGFAYIAPFKNSKKNADGSWSKVMEATFIPGWKGMNQLALRTGAYKTINVVDVRQGELKKYNRLTEEIDIQFEEDEDKRETLPVIGYVGYYKLVNGAEKVIYKTVKQIQAHEKKNRKGEEMGKGWRESWDDMARKTVYRILIGKYGVMSIEYQNHGAEIADLMKDEFLLGSVEQKQTFIDAETGEVMTEEKKVEENE
jgi:recombination protein RecT